MVRVDERKVLGELDLVGKKDNFEIETLRASNSIVRIVLDKDHARKLNQELNEWLNSTSNMPGKQVTNSE
ncbi:MAG: hypothetical protein ACREBS_02100 [Nitrososphaerales archaeon]